MTQRASVSVSLSESLRERTRNRDIGLRQSSRDSIHLKEEAGQGLFRNEVAKLKKLK